MKQLYILRHAKTNQISKTGRDYDRELLQKGVAQLEELKQYFSVHPFRKPTDVWISSAKRTQQTYEGIQKTVEASGSVVSTTFFDDLYLTSYQLMLKKIWNHSSDNDLLIVGHNFGISDAVSYFTEQDIELRTGEFIHLSFDCDVWNETSKGTATVLDRFRPLKDEME